MDGLFFGKWACFFLTLGFLDPDGVLFLLEEFLNKDKVALPPHLILQILEFPLLLLHFSPLLRAL